MTTVQHFPGIQDASFAGLASQTIQRVSMLRKVRSDVVQIANSEDSQVFAEDTPLTQNHT